MNRLQEFSDLGIVVGREYTTRPARYADDDAYHFVSNEEYQHLRLDRKVSAHFERVVNGDVWKYGVPIDTLKPNYVVVTNPSACEQLRTVTDVNAIYLDVDTMELFNRSLKRGDRLGNVCQRCSDDKNDFDRVSAELVITAMPPEDVARKAADFVKEVLCREK
ncbi:hypothetical protein FACS1894188_04540 [Clostridia bacterium]|nr:hypothetical protein FACS1894188_04540 [Clostridia bacterium]